MLLFALLVALPPSLLLTAGMVLPSRIANKHLWMTRSLALNLLLLACLGAVGAAWWYANYGPLDTALASWSWPLPLNFGVYVDGLSAVMALLISFIGLIIVGYSYRYMDGDVAQGRFLRWIMVTLGAVLLMVLSRNLVMFLAAWILTSVGLHQLLMHYPERPWAIWAARKRFLISRLGDALLVVALALTFYCFGTFDYRDVFAGAQEIVQSEQSGAWLLSLIAFLFVVGAMTKSAQFPFHSWLPDTMETPTPVSALMHAGVINAGGFLMIRLSPFVSHSQVAMGSLALVGAFTALFGAVVMLTQTSIKRSLAYSTIAQMGFMMLQCGLGAYSAALLHIVAHSLYKAYAFLRTGSVLESAARVKGTAVRSMAAGSQLAALPIAVVLALLVGGSSSWMLGMEVTKESGTAVLGFILTLALSRFIWQSLVSGSLRVALQGIALAILVSWLYLGGWLAMNEVLHPSVPHLASENNLIEFAILGLVAAGFVGVFVLQDTAERLSRMPFLRTLYIHAANGFYLDIPARRLTARIWGDASPTP